MSDHVFWVITIGGILSFASFFWYYVSLGKRITKEEKEAGRDLTNEINPFTGSANGKKKKGPLN